jgi:hypothetical protein
MHFAQTYVAAITRPAYDGRIFFISQERTWRSSQTDWR